MARYRPVFTGLWVCDDKFQDYSASAKLLFLFLITNDHLGEAGIYKITYKTMSNETALTVDRVKKLIHGELKNNISYDERRSVIFVHKFLKFNGAGNPELIKKSINKDRRLIKTNLWAEYDNLYTKDLKYIDNHLKTLSSNSNTNSNTNGNSKKTYGQDELDQAFDKIWEIWPRKEQKGKAREKYNHLVNTKKIEPERLYKATVGYLKCEKSKETEKWYVMYLKTFFYAGNKSKKIPGTWEEYEKYYDPKYKIEPKL